MATEFDDLSQIRHVRNRDPVAEKPTSQPTRALERRLKILEDRLSVLAKVTELNQLVLRDVPVKVGEDAVVLDDVVYYNASSGLFEKAAAGVTFTEGGFQFNPSALAIGVCINLGSGTGDIMIAGSQEWRDGAHKENMVESVEDFSPGIPYYLSDDEPGKLTKYPPSLRIQILVATDTHFILLPAYSQPDAIENLTKVSVGMRSVGAIRMVPPTYEQAVIVGFDGLEKYVTTDLFNVWRLTSDSSVAALRNFGYMVADIELTQLPEVSIYIRVITGTDGMIRVFSANTLAELSATSSGRFNEVTSFTTLSGNANVVRTYAVKDINNAALGSLKFKFVDNDHTLERHVIFKFPDSFQGWKMVRAPITPLGQVILSGGKVTAIKIQEPGIGYKTPPAVVIEGTGQSEEAQATAVLDEFGSIDSVIIDEDGDDYTAATVRFDTRVTGVRVENGGKNAVVTATESGGEIDSITISDPGEGYWSVPSAIITDPDGSGAILQVETINGAISAINIVDPGSGYTDPQVVILPNANAGYLKTKVGSFTAVLTGDAVTSITIGNGGKGYLPGAKVHITGNATATATIDANGTITGFTITSGGSGYSSPPTVTVDKTDPILLIDGGTPATNAAGTLDIVGMVVDRIDILSAGYAYSPGLTITASGGLGVGGEAALFSPVLDPDGRIIEVKVLYPGKLYESPPSLVLASGGDGNGFLYRVVMSAHVAAGTITNPGDQFQAVPSAQVAVPVSHIEVDDGGSGYTSAPAVTVADPAIAFGGEITATAVSRIGGQLKSIRVLTGGTAYDPSDTFAVTGGLDVGGQAALIAASLDESGTVIGIDILDPGYGYTSLPSISITTSTGSGATFGTAIEGVGTVVRIEMTNQGYGYTGRPVVTIADPSSGITALATAKLLGEGATLTPVVAGDGGLRKIQTSVLAEGNALQIKDYNNDVDESSTVSVLPKGATFYYNMKADLTLKARYPAIPPTKAIFSMNGTDLAVTGFNEASGVLDDKFADVLLTKKTLLWTTLDADACPWDREARTYILDLGSGGQDHIIQDSGPVVNESAPYKDSWWRWWENLFKYEPSRNKAWIHLNKPSRFHQSGKVMSLGVMSPLRLIDVLSGVEAKNDGTPMVGQLLMVLDNQINILGGTMTQVDTSIVNNIVAIYVNNTGRMVMVSSIILQCVFQKNSTTATPTVDDAALVTVGTLEGNYRNFVGTLNPSEVTQEGKSICLYAVNQVKELFPDGRESAPLLLPNEPLYMRVDNPTGGAILSQIVLARVKGHVL